MIKSEEFITNARIVSHGRIVDLLNLKEYLRIEHNKCFFRSNYQKRLHRILLRVDAHLQWLFTKKFPKQGAWDYERWKGVWLLYPAKAKHRPWYHIKSHQKPWRENEGYRSPETYFSGI